MENLLNKEILMLQGFGNYTWIHYTDHKRVLVSKTMQHLLDHISENYLMRVHKSYSVNKYHILKANAEKDGVVLSDGHVIEVSRRKKKEIFGFIAGNQG